MEFYGPVENALKEKLAASFGRRAQELLEKEFGFALPEESAKFVVEKIGADAARNQFAQIIEFMSGKRPGSCSPDDAKKPGGVKCMILIYEGESAIKKIRDVLGPTDPLKAPGGTVRREFGSNVMINTAHASDSPENYEREKDIVRVNENSLTSIIKESLGGS
jgi:hypothetical protein